ncbi:ADAMTS-like protein 5 [Dermacentor albipictus]|uniref:ADAMTS-like protein 5 n=1 Tax=Dermacentor albipictus TaxID=60249 RepID=UPI0038FC6B9A
MRTPWSPSLLLAWLTIGQQQFSMCRARASSSSSSSHQSWSDWNVWSPCSRTCGGGITTRARPCLARSSPTATNSPYSNCSRTLWEHKLCNTERCPPGSEDFTDVQCSAFNNRFMGNGRRVSKWFAVERHTQKRNPCELRCRSQDSTMIFSFGKMADGTSCGQSKICVNGRCKDVGCDGIIESGVRMDECGVCGGRSLSCIQVQQMSSTQGELYKYMAVTIIPRGATNIRVEDDSHNVLTLWDHWPSRSIVPNKGISNKTIRWETRKLGGGTSTILAGGTSFTHEMAENGSEALTAVGPTMKPVTLAVYMVKKANSSVRYQYWVPKEDNRWRSSVVDPPSYLIQKAAANASPPTAEHHFRRARLHAGPLEDNAIPFLTDQVTSTITSSTDGVSVIPTNRHRGSKTRHKPGKEKTKKGKCPVCHRPRNQLHHFCKSDVVIQATVLSADFVEGSVRYDVAVAESYRNLVNLQQREYLWARDRRCACPRLRVGREYVVMAREQRNLANKESKLVVDSKSFVRRFTERRHRQLSRLRKLQGRKCNLTT